METIAHHTCLKIGTEEEDLTNSPFLSEWTTFPKSPPNKDKHKRPFLGTGFYFWDYNYNMAIKWGQTHCNNQFRVIQYNLNTKDETVFDLVGNRMHMEELIKLLEIMLEMNVGLKADVDGRKFSIGKIIHHLTLVNRKQPGFFPYRVFKAIYFDSEDQLKNEQNFFTFVNRHDMKAKYIDLNPRIIICIKEGKDLYLHNRTVIFNS